MQPRSHSLGTTSLVPRSGVHFNLLKSALQMESIVKGHQSTKPKCGEFTSRYFFYSDHSCALCSIRSSSLGRRGGSLIPSLAGSNSPGGNFMRTSSVGLAAFAAEDDFQLDGASLSFSFQRKLGLLASSTYSSHQRRTVNSSVPTFPSQPRRA